MTEQTIEYQTAAEQTDIAEYQTTAAALALLREKYGNPILFGIAIDDVVNL